MNEVIWLNEDTAALRRVKFILTRSSDNVSPATSAVITAGTAQICANGGAAATSSNVITEVNATDFPGLWYLELTAGEITTAGIGSHYVRFKEADCLESVGGNFQISPDDVWTAASGVTVSAINNNVITAASIATGAITNTKFAAGAIDAAAIAADAIGASELAADAVTEIANGILKLDLTGITGEAARSLVNAIRMLRNRKAVNTGTNTVTVYKEDDTTAAFTIVYTGTDPVITDADPT